MLEGNLAPSKLNSIRNLNSKSEGEPLQHVPSVFALAWKSAGLSIGASLISS